MWSVGNAKGRRPLTEAELLSEKNKLDKRFRPVLVFLPYMVSSLFWSLWFWKWQVAGKSYYMMEAKTASKFFTILGPGSAKSSGCPFLDFHQANISSPHPRELPWSWTSRWLSCVAGILSQHWLWHTYRVYRVCSDTRTSGLPEICLLKVPKDHIKARWESSASNRVLTHHARVSHFSVWLCMFPSILEWQCHKNHPEHTKGFNHQPISWKMTWPWYRRRNTCILKHY